jgi:hypothetical protein
MSVTRISAWLCVVLFALGCATVVPAQETSQTAAAPPPISGTGTTNFIPLWTNSTTLGNSRMFQTTTSVTVPSNLSLPASGTATALKGFNSQPLDLAASAFNKTIATAVNEHFQWITEPVGNNTAAPSGKLNLLFAPGSAAPAETGVSFSNAGILTAKRLTSTVATGTAPFTVSSTTLVPNLNVSFLGGFASSAFAKLSGGNAFSGNQSVTGNVSATGTVAGGAGSFTSLSAGTGTITGNLSVNGSFGTSGNGTFSGGLGVGGGLSVGGDFSAAGVNNFFSNPIRFTDDGVGGDLQQPLLVNSVDCCNFGTRMLWAHSPAFPTWGIFYDDDIDVMYWLRNLGGANAMSLDFTNGDLFVEGAITAGVKDFKIDHPLDPQNKYLYHSSVESSEMMNIYTGNAVMDNSGEAVISLPKWFESLNADFRYQLTAIGAAAPNLHVAQEIAHHQFSIAGGAPGMKVSWQITGVRHDAYAKAHPLVVEVKKAEKERGHYLHPDAYGVPRFTQEEMLRRR